MTKIAIHQRKRLVKIVFSDGSAISGTERQWMADHAVGGKDCGQRLIAEFPRFADLADARARIASAFAEWDRREADREDWLENG